MAKVVGVVPPAQWLLVSWELCRLHVELML